MKKLFLLLITALILSVSCQPYVPVIVSSVLVRNETEYELHYRIYKDDSEILPPYRLWDKNCGFIRLELDEKYRIDAYLVTPEKEVVKDSLIYKVREIFAETTYAFNSGHEEFYMHITLVNDHLEFETEPWRKKPT